ncbi:uncharacterized protein LOC108743500 [Agrilus planipennis]|uniref:Uncharacterized protein LOC108743500 n=1 Tax=Agrilus planipennis TaxID=224129 RepID=A0A1W4XEL2_AGRPL|nr:uncharacterized protein LOC108743500 [Agrilus planipennis]
MDIKCIIFATVVLCISLINSVDAIKCWDCRSDADPKCSDPFDNSTFAITDCQQQRLEFIPDAKSTMCRKIRQKVHGVWKYIRSCAFLGEPGIEGDERFCLMRTGTYNIFMEYCTCNSKDGCNSSSSLKGLPVIVSLASLFSILMVQIFR